MAIGAIYELTHTYRLFGKMCNNVYHYRAELADSSAGDLVAAFQEDILPAVGAIQTYEVTSDRIRVITLFDFTDFHDAVVAEPPRAAFTDTLPRSVAINFTLRTNVRNIGPGAKRYAGVSAAYTNDNTFTDSAFMTDVNLLRVKLAQPIGAIIEDVYKPVIVKRVHYDATPTSKAGWYMPREEADLEWAYVTNVAVATDISHQVSRD